MKEVKVFMSVIALTVSISIVILFVVLSNNGGTLIDMFPGQDTGSYAIALAFLVSCVFGGIGGILIGLFSAAYLMIVNLIYEKLRIPVLPSVAYAIIVGGLILTFCFGQISNQYSTYPEAVRENIVGLTTVFVSTSAIVLLPLILTKKYFEI